ncbi:MAG: pilin [bacterium]|nr:pilin [bacterium]
MRIFIAGAFLFTCLFAVGGFMQDGYAAFIVGEGESCDGVTNVCDTGLVCNISGVCQKPASAPSPGVPSNSQASCPPGAVCIDNPLKATTLLELLNNIINLIFNLAIVITPLMVVIGGFMFVTGSGDAKKLSDAKTLLLWTAIGFAVILLSRGLVAALLDVLGT